MSFLQIRASSNRPRTDDFGIDLYCALFDQIGQGAAVRDYFSVQVKSGLIPWEFKTAEQVRWLLEYPTPILLACVDKKKLTAAIYHVMIRFLLRALGSPGSLVLIPEDAGNADSLGGVGGQIGLYKLPAAFVISDMPVPGLGRSSPGCLGEGLLVARSVVIANRLSATNDEPASEQLFLK